MARFAFILALAGCFTTFGAGTGAGIGYAAGNTGRGARIGAGIGLGFDIAFIKAMRDFDHALQRLFH